MKKVVLVITTLLISITLCAKPGGIISGYVKDKADNRSLPGATLRLDKFNRYTISDQNGYFEFLNVPEDSYTLEVNYLGYTTAHQSVSVSGGGNVALEIFLSENVTELNSVVIMGDMLRGQAKALNTQKTNTRISNVISSDQVGRFPDSNIGDALKRVPGITMQNDQGEARNIVVRGLASELNSVTLNGNRIPSAEGDNRKVQMDLIPSDMIQTVEVSKTLTADMDADAIGGSVDLITRAAPNGRRISATILGGYNPIREGGTYSGSFIYGNRLFNDKLGFVVSASYQNKDYGSDNIEAVWVKDDKDKIYIEEMDIRKYDVQRIRRSISANVDWRINDNHTLAADVMYNWRDDRENRYRTRFKGMETVYGDDGQFKGYEGEIRRQTKGGIDNNRNKNRRLEDQRVQSYSLRGQHLITEKFDLDWNIGYSKASEDRPHERYIEYQQKGLTISQDLSDTRKPFISSADENYDNFKFKELTENHDYTTEDELSAKINARVPLSVLPDQKGRLRFGARARIKNKKRDNIFYAYTPLTDFANLSGMSTVNYTKALAQGKQYVPGMFISPEYLGGLQLYNSSLFEQEAVPEEYVASNYKADESVWAGYLRWDQNITNNLLLILGLRGEHTRINYTGNRVVDEDYENIEQIKEKNSYFNLLPGVTLKYDVTKDFILRAAVTTALARPNYYVLVPYSQISTENGAINIGNPDLKATYALNFDLMGEYYFKSVGLLSGGVFYKRLNDFIYTYLNTNYTRADFASDFPEAGNPIPEGERWNFTRPMNGDNVDVYGFEVAIQRKLDFMPSRFLRNFAVYLNYTYTHSVTKGIYNADGEERTDVDLPGTAPHMFNASLSWENKRLSARASLNYTGSYIDEVADERFSDRFYDKQLFLDVNASFKFTPKLVLFAEANNLTNQALRYYQGSKERMMQLEYYKPTFNIGLKYDF